uniref:F-box domain-containing protein n=1 Tax=Salix viminalis TaxID=40686 RepID=A0A6N2L6Z9_SALVM
MESRRDGRDFGKMKKTTTYFLADDSEIPDGVLMEILSRLPLKPIFKFKCVSKRWLSVISDPSFAMARIEKKNREFSAKDMLPRLTFKNHPDFQHRNFSLEFLTREVQPQNQPIKVLSTSNGLILCCNTQRWQTDYYICNPLTTQWFSLPRPLLVQERVSIGFSSGDRSYRVVRIVQSSDESAVLNLEIFSSDTAVVYNEIMHWSVSLSTILAYDPNVNSDQCRLINLPIEKRLCYLRVDVDDIRPLNASLRVWELKNYDSGEWFMRSKTLLADIASLDYLSISNYLIMPLAFHPFDTDTVYFHARGCIASCNLRTRRWAAITDKLIPGGCVNEATVFPFVLPPWPTQIPQPVLSQFNVIENGKRRDLLLLRHYTVNPPPKTGCKTDLTLSILRMRNRRLTHGMDRLRLGQKKRARLWMTNN